MGLLFSILIILISLAWLGLMLLNLIGVLAGSGERYTKGPRGRVLVIIPCKGRDVTLEQNLLSVKRQNYRNMQIIAVVDSADDQAIGAIRRARINCIVAAKRHEGGSGKVTAIITAMRRFRDFDIYVVIDSDVQCARDHVSRLVAPLSDRKVGVATTYPYFNPVRGFWSKVKMAWGFVGNGMMESTVTRFVWGGSMAFRKSLIDSSDFKLFQRALSDDIAVAHFAKEKGLGITYVNSHSITVNADDNFQAFWEWSNRQTALSILGNRKVLRYGLLFYFAQALTLLSGIILSLRSLWYLILLLPFAIGIIKMYSRAKRPYLALLPISLIINFIFITNLVVGARMREILWRGSRYRLRNPF